MKHYWLRKWKKRLNIKSPIFFCYIGKQPKENVGRWHFVGICGNVIFHDRRLKEIDVVHELIHYKYPRYKESTVRKYTKNLLDT